MRTAVRNTLLCGSVRLCTLKELLHDAVSSAEITQISRQQAFDGRHTMQTVG